MQQIATSTSLHEGSFFCSDTFDASQTVDPHLQRPPKQERRDKMHHIGSHSRRYVLAAVLGAIGGGIVVALATKAVPRMMSGMMRNMMAQMGEDGCDPAEM